MGSSASKPAASASQALRKYPTRVPRPTPTKAPSGKASAKLVQPDPSPSKPRTPDPELVTESFSKRLHQMGIVDPNPTYSPSSTAASHHNMVAPQGSSSKPSRAGNHTLVALERRRELQRMAEAEIENIGQKGHAGREFLDIGTITSILVLRQRGQSAESIEKKLKLKNGVVDRLGGPGTIDLA